MGPKRKGKRSRKESSPESSGDELLNSDTDVKLDAVQKNSDEDVDDPGTPQKKDTRKPENTQKEIEEEEEDTDEKGIHTCLMSSVAELLSQFKSSRCTSRTPAKVSYKDIVSHYYLHYRERGHWDKVVPPSSGKQIESYQCKICDQKFRVRLKDDPEPSRASFLYHYATQHGKIIDAMREDRKVDMTKVLNILNKHNFDIRKYIIDGTDPEFDSDPCIIREVDDWKKNHFLQGGNANGTNGSALNGQTTFTPPEYFPCPKNTGKDCKELDKNKDPTTLKLHLFYHYLDYWKDTVPEMISKESKCYDCMKRITAETPAACRISMICHRAIIHGELKLAIEDDPAEFDKDLFDRIFNNKKPVQVMYSKALHKAPSDVQTAVQDSSPVTKPSIPSKPVSNNVQITTKPPVKSPIRHKPSKPLRKSPQKSKTKKKKLDSDDSSSSEEEKDDVIIPAQPYVRKRLKQDLSGISFDDDSDVDEDWESRKKKNLSSLSMPRRDIPKRRRAAVKESLRDLSDSE